MKNKTWIINTVVNPGLGSSYLNSQVQGDRKECCQKSAPRPLDLVAPVNRLEDLRGAELNWPLFFIQNKGQLDPWVSFYLQGGDRNIYFSQDGITITMSGLKENSGPSSVGNIDEPGKSGLPTRLTGAAGSTDLAASRGG